MPPSPGKIHPLPVKIIYSIDNVPQAYLTLLQDRSDVYVHAPSPATHERAEESLGSCYLKAIAQGICFSSPECIPNANLDYSMYTLDPSIRPRLAHNSQQSPNFTGSSSSSSEDTYTGKGFLSWALSESNQGNTLVKGRLVREHEFSSSAFNEQGGLEGLMAAAAQNGGGGDGMASGGDPEAEYDGKGWGLEVCVCLRSLNPEGKAEFRGRREFEDLVARNQPGLAAAMTAPASRSAASSPANPGPLPRAGSSSRTLAAAPSVSAAEAQAHRRPSPLPAAAPAPLASHRINGSTPHLSSPVVSHAQAHVGSSASTVRQAYPTPNHPHQAQQPQPVHRPSPLSTSNRGHSTSSLPPSSIPMAASSSNLGHPSRPSSSASNRPTPQPHHPQPPLQSQASFPAPDTHSRPIAPSAPPPPPSAQRERQDRHTTPPPAPARKSPPPSTPSRHTLRALLSQDGKLSPELVKQLANNTTLLKLLKAGAKDKDGARQQLREHVQNSPAAKNRERERERGERESTPTPTRSKMAHSVSAGSKQYNGEGCYNCGTRHSDLWRSKAMKDGKKAKVCNACGLYFNKHKRMRPEELWGTDPLEAGPSDKKPRNEVHHSPGIRSSPRFRRTGSDVHPSPNPIAQAVFESPRKRQRSGKGPVPQASPRMATRSSARSDPLMNGHSGTHDPFIGAQDIKVSGSGEMENPFLFSPSTMFATSPIRPGEASAAGQALSNLLGAIPEGSGTAGEEQVDIEALLAQISSDQGGFSLESLLSETGEGDADLMGLLGQWDHIEDINGLGAGVDMGATAQHQ